MPERWSFFVDSMDAPGVSPLSVRSQPYRRYELTSHGLMPLTDDDFATGDFMDVSTFSTPARERHYVRNKAAGS